MFRPLLSGCGYYSVFGRRGGEEERRRGGEEERRREERRRGGGDEGLRHIEQLFLGKHTYLWWLPIRAD